MGQKEIIIDNTRVFYRLIGKGPVVILLHGFGEDGNIWKEQWTALKDYRLIIPDLPGSGNSEMINDMSMEGLAACVQTILVAENVISCIMIGHSMGGYITLAFAEKFTSMLVGLGLVHSTSYADSEEKKIARKKGIDFISEYGAAAFLETAIPNLYGPVTKEKNTALIDEHVQSAQPFSKAALIAYYQSMIKRPDRTSVLDKTHLPVLFIFGKHDATIPLHDGLKQSHLPMWSYVHILEESGHMGMVEESKKVNSFITSYISSIYRPSESE
ncbi:MAG TPA: alpha/beta hydrolase [Chitinophagaceae bacterium]|nr:alpha/beta hydrolase [Chitinophagaceae bacterium]